MRGRETALGALEGGRWRGAGALPAALRRLPSAALLSCAVALSACGGGSPDATTGPVPPPTTLEVTLTFAGAAGAGAGGSVEVTVGSESSTHSAGAAFSFAFGADVSLEAKAPEGYGFAGWRLAGGLSCADGPEAPACVLEVDLAAAAAGSPSAEAAFGLVATTLTVSAGAGGSVAVEATVGGGASEEDVSGPSQGFAFNVEATATLTAEPDPGYAFSAWTGACAGQEAACALVGVVGDTTATAAFVALSTLTVTAGPNGSVSAEVAAAAAATVGAGSSQGFAVSVLSAATTLTAVAAAGYESAGWTLSLDSLACAGGTATEVCALPAGSLTADATATATFVAALSTLTVTAGAGGSVSAEVAGAGAVTVDAGSSRGFAVSVLSAATTLTAVVADGYESAGWTLSLDGLACADGTAAHVCALPAGSLTADVTATAAFVALSTLTVTAGDGGSVAVTVGGAAAGSVTAGNSTDVAVTVAVAVALAAMPDGDDDRFVHWVLSDGLACRDGPDASPCMLAPVGADGTADAEFLPLPDSVTWTGPGTVTMDGSTLTAVPYADGAFEEWRGGPCDGSAALECVRSPLPNAGYPVAVFRSFVAAGIKSLAFGLGYQGESPHSFQVSLRRDVGAGYEAPPALEGLPGSGQALASLAAPVHLLPWGRGGYLTEACDASNMCVAADGGERALAQAVSRAATGYFKAPNAGNGDLYGTASVFGSGGSSNDHSNSASFALSADGATLAVGAAYEDSSHTGTFAPDEPGYQTALASGGAKNSGAAYVYRRSDAGQWAIEAYIKAPVTHSNNNREFFGASVALSADGATLAVGAPFEDSAYNGAFVADDEDSDYLDALNDNSASESGAVTVYRRSDADRWAIEAFVKPLDADDNDYFGTSVALSADGATLAVGAPFEDSSHTGTFVPSSAPDSGYRRALDSNGAGDSGAVTVYRRSTLTGTWAVEAFVKAPVAGAGDLFGLTLALSADGGMLAVGAHRENSAFAGAFAPTDGGYQDALDDNGANDSGAATVYRRSTLTGAWAVEAFLKAPEPGSNDIFGASLAFALSAGGDTLVAVGAPQEDSSHTGTFVPSNEPDSGYRRALESNGNSNSGAVTVYRRSTLTETWAVEAFVKAPKTVSNDSDGARFGVSVDLSSNGVVMAAGSSGESGSVSGVFVRGGTGYQGALDSDGSSHQDSGAAYVYRRHRDSGGDPWSWRVEALVKAPNPGDGNDFGTGVALSGDGATLAVGATYEDGVALDQPIDGGRIPDSEDGSTSGAVYLY